jgi:uncharacterized protein YcfL
MNLIKTLLATTLVLAVLGGCGTVNTVTATAGENPGKTDYRTQVNDVLTDIFLSAKAVRFGPTAGGNYEVQVTVANNGFKTRRFSYLFDWIDENGMIIETSMSTWKTASVAAGGTIVISSVAPNDTARTFQLQTRRSN